MASSSSPSSPPSLNLILLLLGLFFNGSHCDKVLPYTSLFSFGDSLADTGNFLLSGAHAFPSIGLSPYGETYFAHPTGRCSDGRLIVDFFAEAIGIPYLAPYLSRSHGIQEDFTNGSNFAVAGATALDPSFFQNKGLDHSLWTNSSLNVQLGWFEELKPSLCSTSLECEAYFNKSLFLLGEIGGNDYNYAFFNHVSMEELRTAYVPSVVDAIKSAAKRLIGLGVMNFVVPGNLPIGCSTIYLTLLSSPDKMDYDSRNGCLKTLNGFAEYHNTVLQRALEQLREEHPRVKIVYADYYQAAIRFFHSPQSFGFGNGSLSACCGGGGPYNFNPSVWCGQPGAMVCKDPSKHVNWDGIHPTEAAYRLIADGLINGLYAIRIDGIEQGK
ncbi:GDSL esterase/lipase [Acorus calamus]|uniref:GDSL esterase/lipase n=1 Tax=Acorus calamus TaxID=4465 RepID=A0AAV9CCF2_ACOCL|nr:GDSL esterase/lipase [Acorus calamus]